MSEFRQNPLTGQWVVIAPARADRPQPQREALPSAAPLDDCPFCPGRERETPPEAFAVRLDGSPPDTPGWSVRVIPNKFPATRMDAKEPPTPESIAFAPKGAAPAGPPASGATLCIGTPATGQHEVIVLSPDHRRGLAELDDRQVRLLLEALRHRYRIVMQSRDVQYACIFQNRGREAGATIDHPHLQLLATSVVPAAAETMLVRQSSFALANGRTLCAALLDEELASGRRIISEHDDFVVLAPWASAAPYETWILPRTRIRDVGCLSDDAVTSLARVVRDSLRRVRLQLGDPPYNLVFHSAPKGRAGDEHGQLLVQIIPRIGGFGGVELACGLFINPVQPEAAASLLRFNV